MKIRFRAGQRLKPNSFFAFYGTAEAVPYKDSAVAKQALKLAPLEPLAHRIWGKAQFRTTN
jgi:hypothetical protein